MRVKDERKTKTRRRTHTPLDTVRWCTQSRLNVQPVDSSVSDPEARGSAKTGDAPRCWVIMLSPRRETFRHAATAGE